jgi:hypothetical protein
MTTTSTFSLRRFLFLFTLSSAATFANANEWQQQTVPMVGVQNYFMERCIEFGAGKKVEFNFTSQHPVNFDVHYHPGNSIAFAIKKENIKELSDGFTSDAADHYCFTWANPVEVGSDWNIQLKYRVVAQ